MPHPPSETRRTRVVVTGLGAVTPLGVGVQESWDALLDGRCGVVEVDAFDTSDTRSGIAGVVQGFDPVEWLGSKRAKRTARFTQLALASARMAMEDAGLGGGYPWAPEHFGVALGVGLGDLSILEYSSRWYYGDRQGRLSPFFIPKLIPNMAAANIAMEYRATGPCIAPAAACASGAQAIGEGFRMIREGRATAVLAGGAESTITPVALLGFAIMRALSTRNHDPGHASRPFDKDRDGFVLAEGAGVVLLESLDSAIERGARIHGEVVGYGSSADAYHLTASTPDGSGPARAMALALEDAGLGPEVVGYVNAHATSTPDGDRAEVEGIKRLLGERAYQVPVSSTKGATGHALGGAGGMETVFTVLALERGIIPHTLNLEDPGDPGTDEAACDPRMDYVVAAPRATEITYALNNSFGFGGFNVSLLLKAWDG